MMCRPFSRMPRTGVRRRGRQTTVFVRRTTARRSAPCVYPPWFSSYQCVQLARSIRWRHEFFRRPSPAAGRNTIDSCNSRFSYRMARGREREIARERERLKEREKKPSLAGSAVFDRPKRKRTRIMLTDVTLLSFVRNAKLFASFSYKR